MKIEIWSDYVCPFCYIGKRNLENAIKSSGLQGKVELEYKAYELSPDSPAVSEESMEASLAAKYNMSLEEARTSLSNIQKQAQAVGLTYDMKNMKSANTFAAHRLAKFAEDKGLGEEMTEALLDAYFVKSKTIGLEATLVEIAGEVGLVKEEVTTMLNSEQYVQDVKEDITQASEVGVRGVPFFVLSGKYAISGAQPQTTFEEALLKVAEEEGIKPGLQILGDDSGTCTDDSCDV